MLRQLIPKFGSCSCKSLIPSELQSSFQNNLGTTDWQAREIAEEYKIEAGQKGRAEQDHSGIQGIWNWFWGAKGEQLQTRGEDLADPNLKSTAVIQTVICQRMRVYILIFLSINWKSTPTHKMKFSLSGDNIAVDHFICTLDCTANKFFIQSFYNEAMHFAPFQIWNELLSFKLLSFYVPQLCLNFSIYFFQFFM